MAFTKLDSVVLCLLDSHYLAVAVQDALAASVLAPATKGLVLDATASDLPELDVLLDSHRV